MQIRRTVDAAVKVIIANVFATYEAMFLLIASGYKYMLRQALYRLQLCNALVHSMGSLMLGLRVGETRLNH
jgi:hypothetical protein